MAQKNMFCYQCEQTAKGQGCTAGGVCGKSPDVAALRTFSSEKYPVIQSTKRRERLPR